MEALPQRDPDLGDRVQLLGGLDPLRDHLHADPLAEGEQRDRQGVGDRVLADPLGQ